MLDGDFKFLGLLSIIMIWLGLLFTIYRWHGDKSMPFSLHAAQTRVGLVYYFLLFWITMPLFYLFIVHWYVPRFDLGLPFVILTTIGVAGQLGATLVPAGTGTKGIIHEIAAYVMGITLIPLSVMIALADVSLFAKIVATMAATYMVGSIILRFTWSGSMRHYLYFQTAYIAAFHIVILTSVYL